MVDVYGNHEMSQCLFNKFKDGSIEDSARLVGWRGDCKDHAADSSECLQEELKKLRQGLYKCFAEPRSSVLLNQRYKIISIKGCPDDEECGMELGVDRIGKVPLVKLAPHKGNTMTWDVRPIGLEGNYFNLRR